MIYSRIANIFLADNSVIVTYRLLTLLKAKVSSRDIKEKILTHPGYGTLLAIYDTLQEHGYSPAAFQVDEKKLDDITFPFIAQVATKNSFLFVVVKDMFDNQITCFDSLNRKKVLPLEEFFKHWTGVCLFSSLKKMDATIKTKSVTTENRFVQYSMLFLAVITVYFVIKYPIWHLFSSSLKVFWITIIILKILGLLVTTILLWHEVDKSNPVVKNLCTSTNKKINCNAVLNSSGSSIFQKLFSWSEIGFSYYFGSLCLIFIAYNKTGLLFLISVISVLSIPMILYSFFYQAFRVRQWCILCISVQLTLLFEALTVGFFSNNSLVFEPNLFLLLFVFLLIPIVTFKVVKWVILKNRVKRFEKRKLNELKSNKIVFQSLLAKSQHIGSDFMDLGIKTTSEEAKYNVLKICNPYCNPCSKAHPILKALLDKKIINLTVIFISQPDLSNPANTPTFHFMTLNDKNEKIAHKAMDFWYKLEFKDYQLLQNSFPVKNIAGARIKVQRMHEWCQKENIHSTPSIFINNQKLPEIYDFNDLPFLLN